jgi:small subunit ribosomal protein S8
MTDPISDMINRILNAQAVLHPTVSIPFSNFKYEIVKILEKEKFLDKTEEKGKKVKRVIEITLKYENKIPAISGLKRVSRPGQRIYAESKEIKKVKGGYGIAVVSTSKGLMTNKEAKKKKLGGEIILEVW